MILISWLTRELTGLIKGVVTMALDIRLDFISKIDQAYIDEMTTIRKLFIDIDHLLKLMADEAHEKNLGAAARSVAIARTHNESACQNAIKCLCILGEQMEDTT